MSRSLRESSSTTVAWFHLSASSPDKASSMDFGSFGGLYVGTCAAVDVTWACASSSGPRILLSNSSDSLPSMALRVGTRMRGGRSMEYPWSYGRRGLQT